MVNIKVSESPDIHFDLYPPTSSLPNKGTSALLPNINNIINLSLASVFPHQFKPSYVHSLLNEPTCDKNYLSNYRSIFHLSFLCKKIIIIIGMPVDANYLHHNHLLSRAVLSISQSVRATTVEPSHFMESLGHTSLRQVASGNRF